MICRLILPRIYDGNIIAQFVTDEVLAQAIYSKEFIQYRPQPELFDSDVVLNGDPFRYTMIALAINRLTKNNIEGSLAEVGVIAATQLELFTIAHLIAVYICSTLLKDFIPTKRICGFAIPLLTM